MLILVIIPEMFAYLEYYFNNFFYNAELAKMCLVCLSFIIMLFYFCCYIFVVIYLLLLFAYKAFVCINKIHEKEREEKGK